MNKEEKAMKDANEEEYQKSLKAKESASKSSGKSGDVKESGYTDGGGNFIVAQNGVLSEAQETQVKEGKWFPYTKGADGVVNIQGKKSEPKDEDNGKKK